MSKGLEALEALKFFVHNYGRFEFDFDTIEKELKRLEKIDNILPMEIRDINDLQRFVGWYQGGYKKQEKILKIIKQSNIIELVKDKETKKCYLLFVFDKVQIGEQEFDLLKEWLSND